MFRSHARFQELVKIPVRAPIEMIPQEQPDGSIKFVAERSNQRLPDVETTKLSNVLLTGKNLERLNPKIVQNSQGDIVDVVSSLEDASIEVKDPTQTNSNIKE